MNRPTAPAPHIAGPSGPPPSGTDLARGSADTAEVALRPVATTLLRVAIVAAATLALAACGDGAAQDAPDAPVPVRTASVERGGLAATVGAPGTYGPADEIALAFKVGGVVARVTVEAGDRVEAGTLLAALEPDEIEAAVSQARAGAEKARRDLARAERLYRDSVAPLAALEDARTAAEVAEAELERADFNRRHAEIRAPAAGVILDRRVEGGETVGAGAPVVVLGTEGGPGVVRLGLPDRDRVQVAVGDPAVVTFGAIPGRSYAGRVSRIGAAASRRTGTWEAEVALDQADGLLPGLVGRVEIRPAAGVGQGGEVALVPVEAVLEAGGDRGAVFVLEESPDAESPIARRRTVRIGALHEGRIVVLGGLEGVDRVVTAGAAWLDDGQRVRVVR